MVFCEEWAVLVQEPLTFPYDKSFFFVEKGSLD